MVFTFGVLARSLKDCAAHELPLKMLHALRPDKCTVFVAVRRGACSVFGIALAGDVLKLRRPNELPAIPTIAGPGALTYELTPAACRGRNEWRKMTIDEHLR